MKAVLIARRNPRPLRGVISHCWCRNEGRAHRTAERRVLFERELDRVGAAMKAVLIARRNDAGRVGARHRRQAAMKAVLIARRNAHELEADTGRARAAMKAVLIARRN